MKSVVQQFTMILKSSSPLSTCCCILQQQQMEETWEAGGTMTLQHQTPPVPAFDSTAELWKDYLLRFETFVNDNSVPDDKKALVFLTNQTSGTYKPKSNYAWQQDVPNTANAMQFSDITDFMSSHYDPTQFIDVRERYKFWSTIKRKSRDVDRTGR